MSNALDRSANQAVLIAILVASLIFFVGMLVGKLDGLSHAKTELANGELACKYVHEKRVCWNPKEVEK